jgi:hypothetical protein
MSRGLGWVQHACLKVLAEASEPLTTFTVTAEIYNVQRDQDDNRWVTDAQHVAVKRALISLRALGLVESEKIGFDPQLGYWTRIDPDTGRVNRSNKWKLKNKTSNYTFRCFVLYLDNTG